MPMKKCILLVFFLIMLVALAIPLTMTTAMFKMDVSVTNTLGLTITPATPDPYSTATLIFYSLDENGERYEYDRRTVKSTEKIVMPDAPSYQTQSLGSTFACWSSSGTNQRGAYLSGQEYNGTSFSTVSTGDRVIEFFDVYTDYYVKLCPGNQRYYTGPTISVFETISEGGTSTNVEKFYGSYTWENQFSTVEHKICVHPGFNVKVNQNDMTVGSNSYDGKLSISIDGGSETEYDNSHTYRPMGYHHYDVTVSLVQPSCIAPGTLVTLADRSQKAVEDITYGDTLLVWDFFKGEYATVPASLIVEHGVGNYTQIALGFEDGTHLNLLEAHALFDADLNKFVLLNADNAEQYIGHRFIQAQGDGYKPVTLTSVEISDVNANSYSIVSAYHYNFIVENMFSLTNSVYPLTAGLEVGENLTYDAETLERDIEQYGLYTYDDLADYVTPEQFEIFAGKYLRISVGKGYLTYEKIVALIERFINPVP